MTRTSSRIVTVVLGLGALALVAVAFSMRRGDEHPQPASYRVLPAPFPAGDVDVRVMVAATSAQLVEATPSARPEDCPPVPVALGTNGGLADTVVALLAVHGGVALPSSGPVLTLERCGFEPRVAVGLAGTTATVRVPRGEHRLQALLGEVRVFDADAVGAARIALVSPGLWNVRCATSHPWEQAYLYVTDNPYAAVSSRDGRVRFSDVPVGSYTVKAWNPERGERTGELLVEVNKTATLTLRY